MSTVVHGKSAVDGILERTSKSQKCLWDLEEKVSLLGEKSSSEKLKELLRSRGTLEVIQDAQRQARNLGEDLLQDQLSLDNVDGLSDSQRALRKRALVLIDDFLNQVDEAKGRLAVLAVAAKEVAVPTKPGNSERLRPTNGAKRKAAREVSDVPAEVSAAVDVVADGCDKDTSAMTEAVTPAECADTLPTKASGSECGKPFKGTKRKARETDVVAGKCRELAAALAESGNVPADVSKMLLDFLPHCLGQPKDKRHRFQEQAIEAVQRILQGIEKNLEKAVEEARIIFNEAHGQVTLHESRLADVQEVLRKESERCTHETKELAKVALEFRRARLEVEEYKKAQEVGDQDYQASAARKTKLQATVDKLISPLENGDVPESEVEESIESLLLALRHLGASFDEAILVVLRSALSKSPSSRGDFERMAIEQLTKSIAKHIDLEDQILKEGETGKVHRLALVEKSQAAFTEASSQQKVQSETFQSCWNAKKNLEEMLVTARQECKGKASQAKSCDKALYAAEANLSVFQDCTHHTFKELMEKSTPMVSQPEQPAIDLLARADAAIEKVGVPGPIAAC